jgi:hypothetical protein
VWPGRDVDHSSPSNAEVKNKYELSFSPLRTILMYVSSVWWRTVGIAKVKVERGRL